VPAARFWGDDPVGISEKLYQLRACGLGTKSETSAQRSE
jgi:hypothetical protein